MTVTTLRLINFFTRLGVYYLELLPDILHRYGSTSPMKEPGMVVIKVETRQRVKDILSTDKVFIIY